MRPLPCVAVGGLLLAAVLAGCSQTGAPGSGTPSDDPLPSLDATLLVPVSAKVHFSAPQRPTSEFSVSRDPSDPMHLVSGRLEFNPTDNTNYCVFARSVDGGRTWQDSPRPFAGTSSDPWVAWAPDGTVHVVCNTSHYAQSHDNGTSWSELPRPPTPGNDRPSILVDAGGRLLHCSSRPGTNQGPTILYSDDSGATWTQSPFTDIATTWEETICNAMAAGPDGTLYAGLGLSMFRLAVSHDRGANWTETAQLGRIDPRRADYGFLVPTHAQGNTFPSFAVSPRTGHVFVGLLQFDAAANNGIGSYSVELHRSQDQGRTFERLDWPSAPATCRRCDFTRPVVHVDDAGRLGALWRSNEGNLPFQTWFSVSLDEGKSWLPPLLLSAEGPTDLPIPTRSIDGADHYWTMSDTPEGFLVFWLDRTQDGVSGLWAQVVKVA
ncbi:MAG TPA: sialidase family protein [Candidatus Thermoplasmatota archaeon]|nr:sialidase family protein [Candidatus Thermoplasmatota archaeon]